MFVRAPVCIVDDLDEAGSDTLAELPKVATDGLCGREKGVCVCVCVSVCVGWGRQTRQYREAGVPP